MTAKETHIFAVIASKFMQSILIMQPCFAVLFHHPASTKFIEKCTADRTHTATIKMMDLHKSLYSQSAHVLSIDNIRALLLAIHSPGYRLDLISQEIDARELLHLFPFNSAVIIVITMAINPFLRHEIYFPIILVCQENEIRVSELCISDVHKICDRLIILVDFRPRLPERNNRVMLLIGLLALIADLYCFKDDRQTPQR